MFLTQNQSSLKSRKKNFMQNASMDYEKHNLIMFMISNGKFCKVLSGAQPCKSGIHHAAVAPKLMKRARLFLFLSAFTLCGWHQHRDARAIPIIHHHSECICGGSEASGGVSLCVIHFCLLFKNGHLFSEHVRNMTSISYKRFELISYTSH
jgi:hypothetical protein